MIDPVNIDPLKRQQPIALQGVTRRAQPDGSQQRNASGEAVLDNITRQNVLQQLKDLPEVRSNVMELGRRLAEDPSYPPDDVIDKLAQIIADLPADWMDDFVEDFEVKSPQ